MTPKEHAARAEELIAEAERLYQICLVDYQTNINEDDHADQPHVPAADLAMLTATTQLAQAHATLALTAPARPSSVPTDEDLGPDVMGPRH
ncbi:hypothetical protein QLQ12_32350 [Actinoplanes sp. NEAU-A12]|uniref:Uncharacterized protein n=1 Tax=Actinoplanes sandaracinus TaxID=3045177 RepID=A0ABT6WUL6_9ACTN|nr:hypothetical protein [Actinoplanes sandaracinus]MDI6103310.1 hypothetical protein [Actinoplanes sandaracinus]